MNLRRLVSFRLLLAFESRGFRYSERWDFSGALITTDFSVSVFFDLYWRSSKNDHMLMKSSSIAWWVNLARVSVGAIARSL